jgi:hypothetical protein
MPNDTQAEAPHSTDRPISSVLDALKAATPTGSPDKQGRLVLARALLGSADERVLAAHSSE